MTAEEQEVITQAYNLAYSIVAGDWDLPAPMNVAINALQDAALALAASKGIGLKDGCSKDFLEFQSKYWSDLGRRLR